MEQLISEAARQNLMISAVALNAGQHSYSWSLTRPPSSAGLQLKGFGFVVIEDALETLKYAYLVTRDARQIAGSRKLRKSTARLEVWALSKEFQARSTSSGSFWKQS